MGLRNNDGKIGCALYAAEKGFPKDASAAAQLKMCGMRVVRDQR